MPIRILLSQSTNPWFNLATEDWIFRELDPRTHVLFLWRNADTVVIGRHQNPWVECRVQNMEADGIFLARRQSGGGAVFHDLGNTNFTFLSSSAGYNQDANFQIIIAALSRFGIHAERSGRNDILVDGFKVSGSAFKHTRERSFHHGTLLLHADLGRLTNYLNPSAKKLESKGIKSVRSRVANLETFAPGIDHAAACTAVIDAFRAYHGEDVEPETLDLETLQRIPSLNEYYQQMADWEWRFGNTPDFTHHLEQRFAWGGIDLHLDVHKGCVERAKVYSDALFPEMIDSLNKRLVGVRYAPEALREVLESIARRHPQEDEAVRELSDWLVKAL